MSTHRDTRTQCVRKVRYKPQKYYILVSNVYSICTLSVLSFLLAKLVCYLVELF